MTVPNRTVDYHQPISSAKKAQRKLANLPMVENAVLRDL
jgi:hypothetical protein